MWFVGRSFGVDGGGVVTDLDRRRLLRGLGAAALPVALAGCSGDDDDSDGGGEGTPTDDGVTTGTAMEPDANEVPGGSGGDETETTSENTTTTN